ncbi:hypothetical protein V8C42DRAFT_282694 [Trichoderma barbatum]
MLVGIHPVSGLLLLGASATTTITITTAATTTDRFDGWFRMSFRLIRRIWSDIFPYRKRSQSCRAPRAARVLYIRTSPFDCVVLLPDRVRAAGRRCDKNSPIIKDDPSIHSFTWDVALSMR